MSTQRTSTPTHTQRSEGRREQLLDAAERLFAERGVSGTTVADITTETGVAKGTFYLYFATKEQLLGALKERFIQGMVDLITEAVRDLDPSHIFERTDQLVATGIDYEIAHRGLLEIAVRESADPDTAQLFAEANRRMIGLIEAAIHTGANAGLVNVDHPELTAAMIHFGMSGTVNHFLLYEEEVDRDRLVAAGQALVRRTLGAPPHEAGSLAHPEVREAPSPSQEPSSGTV